DKLISLGSPAVDVGDPYNNALALSECAVPVNTYAYAHMLMLTCLCSHAYAHNRYEAQQLQLPGLKKG
ncbi:MAG: hypothetical protein MJA27_06030, partial [Pseudanabaenales cyanobacterium]|nr:hypothetical protein [Pseudanabaenales cyanobacterium]